MESVVYEWLRLLVLSEPQTFFSVKYEPELFKFRPNRYGCTAYVPDFKLITKRGIRYIEVKGYMDFFDDVKIKLFKKNYPWVRIRVIRPKDMDFIKQSIRRMENR